MAGAEPLGPLALGTAVCDYSLVVGDDGAHLSTLLTYLPFAGPCPLPTLLLVWGIFLLTGFCPGDDFWCSLYFFSPQFYCSEAFPIMVSDPQ